MSTSSFISPRSPATPGGIPRRLLAGVLIVVVVVAMSVYWIASGEQQSPGRAGMRNSRSGGRALDVQTRGSSHSVDEAADRAAAASNRAGVASGPVSVAVPINGASTAWAGASTPRELPGLSASRAPLSVSSPWLSPAFGASASAQVSSADPGASAREMDARSVESRIFDEPAPRPDQAGRPTLPARVGDAMALAALSAASGVFPADVAGRLGSPGNDASLVGTLVNDSMRQFAPPAQRDLAQREDDWQSRFARPTTALPPLVARPAAGPLVVEEGTVIPAVLTRRIDSDAPGVVTALVNIDVYDSRTARCLLLPKGSRLVGRYDNDVATGQERLQFAFTRLILPDGSSFDLPGAGGSDVVGQAGLPADVDRHFFQRFGAALLIGMIADRVVAPKSVPATNAYGGGLSATGQVLVNTADAELHRNESIAPTLTVAEGTRLNVEVMRDMVFAQPYFDHP